MPPLSLLFLLALALPQQGTFLREGDTLALVGNALAERQQHHGWFETWLQATAPELQLSVRNLGFAGDELTVRQRTQGFGSPDDHLTRVGADVVVLFFGFVESFAGTAGVEAFEADLAAELDRLSRARYGEEPPRIALVAPIPYERVPPTASFTLAEGNARVALYGQALARAARERGLLYLNAFTAMQIAYRDSAEPLTIDGIHLNEAGDRALGRFLARGLAQGRVTLPEGTLERVRAAVLEKNLLWFNRYRATDGYNVYGGRSSLAYTDGQTNYEVLQRELEILDVLCANLDHDIHGLAAGAPCLERVPVPAEIPVPTNRPGAGADGAHPYLSGEAAIEEMTLPEDLEITLFADEERFPEIANPVQMAFDPRGRLWVAAWPTYPHWKPGEEMDDRLVILEDTDGDGRADESTVFAGGLHNPTGFEFWNGGVYLACAPDLLFLEDTDGDDRADRVERVLGALSSADTHHSANSFVIGPEGALYFQEGTFHMSQVETPHGTVRNRNGCVWRFEPRTWRVERYVPYNFANPHGHVFDRWGQDFVTDGTGNVNYYALPFSGYLPEPLKHSTYFSFFPQRSRPAAATEILSSPQFPEAYRENYLIANVIGFQGVFRYELHGDGSGFGATELEPLVQSSDPNFRPVDLEVGPDGAVWLLDWQTPLIGHMQHHLRDPSRDHEHGRVYRIRAKDRPLSAPPTIAGRPVDELVALLDQAASDRLRQRVRAELSARSSPEVVGAARRRVDELGPEGDERALLEMLWLQQQHGALDRRLLERLLAAERFEARAAATRAAKQLRHQLPDVLDLLAGRIADPHPRVRLEALVGLSFVGGQRERGERATELALEVLAHPRDRFCDYALEETLRALEHAWRPALVERAGFLAANAAGLGHLLGRLTPAELLRVPDSAPLFDALLARPGLPAETYARAIDGLARRRGVAREALLLDALESTDRRTGAHVDHMQSELFALLDPSALDATGAARLEALRVDGKRRATRRLATAAVLERPGTDPDALLDAARGDTAALLDLLAGAVLVEDPSPALAEALVPELLHRLDAPRPAAGAGVTGRYVRVELPGASRTLTLAEVQVLSDGVNVAPNGTATQSTTNWGGAADRAIDGGTSPRWGDGGQTHTIENRPDPWWELDLGREVPIDEVVVFNRREPGGDLWRRLDGFRLVVLDARRRTSFEEAGLPAPDPSVRLRIGHPDALVRRAAARALAHVVGAKAAPLLVARAASPPTRAAALEGLRRLGAARLDAEQAAVLARTLIEVLDNATGDADRALLAFAGELADAAPLEHDLGGRLARAVRRAGPQVLVVRPVPDSLLFDRKLLVVVAGRPVELVFENTDLMPHNLVVTAPGALARVGLAAEAMALEKDAWEAGYVPALDEVLQATRLLQPGESQTLVFDAPDEPGDHPFVCTFPGHWARMNGVLRVVAGEAERDALEREAAPAEAATPTAAGRSFVRSWTVADLAGDLDAKRLAAASPARGLATFATASCTRCHEVGGAGGGTGPPIEEALGRHATPLEVLTHVLEPSRVVQEGYATEILELSDGTFVVGRVVAEEPELYLVQDDPYDSETLLEVERAAVAHRTVSHVSAMPTGILSTFTREEVLDLLAFLESVRDTLEDAEAAHGER